MNKIEVSKDLELLFNHFIKVMDDYDYECATQRDVALAANEIRLALYTLGFPTDQ